MATFRYVALTAAGERTRGQVEGASMASVLTELERRSLTPIDVTERKAASLPLVRRGSVPAKDLAQAYTQVADLFRAGVPLLRALRLIANRKSAPKLAVVFGELADAVEDGDELAHAMAQKPAAFRPIHVAMVRAGEKGGFLEDALARLGSLVQHQVDLRRKVIGASTYPAAIAVVGVLILVGLFVFFVPIFRQQFTDVDLPALTKALFATSDAVRNGWWLGPLLFVVGAALWVWLGRIAEVRRWVADAVVRVPMVGTLIRDLAIARVCRVLGTLLASGVPVLDALAIARDAAGFPAMRAAIESATESVRGGEPLAGPLGDSGLFPDDVIEMIAVAEAANNMDHVLVAVADTLDERVDRLLTTVVRLIEPALLLTIAAGVVTVALGLILAMMRLTSAVQI